MRLTALVVEASEAEELARFWAGALDWRIAESGAVAAVRPPEPGGVELRFVPSTRPKTAKNRLHLDLAGGSDLQGQVRRLLGLGAVRADIGQRGVAWEVLADPEGNEFCVLPRPDSGGRLWAFCQDAADPAVQGPFWAAATGWPVVDRGDWGVSLRAPAGTGPRLVMGPPVAAKSGANRLRFSLSAPLDPAAGLLEAGAVDLGGGQFADPEGNEFLVER
jgi:hypothetical protein